MKEEIDFYNMGQKNAEDTLNSIYAQAKLIERKYGYAAKGQFELGAVSVLNPYVQQASDEYKTLYGDSDTYIESYVKSHK